MDIFEKLRQWLLERGILPAVDSCALNDGDTGLFPLGMEQVRLKEDVLGNRVRQRRHIFILRRTAVPGVDAATWLLQLQEAAAKHPPQLGENQQFRAEKGRLVKNTSTGLGIYELRLIAEREEVL